PVAGLPGARPRGEAGQRLGYLADVAQLPLVQPAQEAGLVAVALIERQPVEGEAVSQGAVHLPQGDLPLGAVADSARDAVRLAAVRVLVPGRGVEPVGGTECV